MTNKVRTTAQGILITHTLSDNESNLFIRCKIFDENLVDQTNNIVGSPFITLTNIFNGFYGVKLTEQFPSEGQYIIVFEIFEDSGFSTYSIKYGTVEEDYWVTNFEQTLLDEVPDNILLDNDPRLDNLNLIPNLSNESTVTSLSQSVIDQLTEVIDQGDGGAT
jgi:hypothetical protein